MAFCSNCGNQISDNAKFCAQCGTTVVGAKSSSVPGVTPAVAAPIPAPSAPPPPPPPAPAPAVAAYPVSNAPVHYVPAGQVPVAVAMPPAQSAQKKNGMIGTIIILAIAAGLGYYYYDKNHPTNTQGNTPPVTQPPSTNNPPSNPPSQGNGNAALLQQQQLNAEWKSANGFIVVDAKWTNSSSTNLASAVMECDQYDTGGTDLSQFRMTLNGPTPPNTWSSYSNVQMGEAANGVNKLVCNLVHVTPSN